MSLLDALVHTLDPNHAAHMSSDPARYIPKSVEGDAPAASCCAMGDDVFDEIEARKRKARAVADEAGAPSQAEGRSNASEDADAESGAKALEVEAPGRATSRRAHGRHGGSPSASTTSRRLATFVATLDDPAVGGALALAIAIHNIPEGLCVSIPIYFATGDRWKAFRWALLSGVSEPVGALLGWLLRTTSTSSSASSSAWSRA
ncbi:zinc ion transmembrane transporter [Aureococcus anophagefferens]|nr:zinc ion transmembrane transporter [Aureococcus anophagefferens]